MSLLIVALLVGNVLGCNGVSYDGICLNVINNGAIVIAGDYGDEDIYIPDYYQIKIIVEITNSIESIESGAFKETPIRSVSISRKMQNVGAQAFYGCYNLETVEFRGTTQPLTIETSAFENCVKLKTFVLNLAKEVFIKTRVFAGCTSLQTMDFYNVPLYNYIEASTFESCTSLNTIKFNHVSTINSYAFKYCENLDIIDLSQVSSIGSFAFERCIKLYASNDGVLQFDSITSIGIGAFTQCSSIKKVIYPFTSPPADHSSTISVFPTSYKDGQHLYDIYAYVPSAYSDAYFYNIPVFKPVRTPDLSPLPASPFITPFNTPFSTPDNTPSNTQFISPFETPELTTYTTINDEFSSNEEKTYEDSSKEDNANEETTKEYASSDSALSPIISEGYISLNNEEEDMENLENDKPVKTDSNNYSTIIIIVSAICAILAIIIIVLVVIFFVKFRKNNNESYDSDYETSSEITSNSIAVLHNVTTYETPHSEEVPKDVQKEDEAPYMAASDGSDPFTTASDITDSIIYQSDELEV